MCSTLTIPIQLTHQHQVILQVSQSDLSLYQLQILAGMVFATQLADITMDSVYTFYCMVEGKTLSYTSSPGNVETWTWDQLLTIKHRTKYDKCKYMVYRTERGFEFKQYTEVCCENNCDDKKVCVRFNNGLLNDKDTNNPAIEIKKWGSPFLSAWFHNNISCNNTILMDPSLITRTGMYYHDQEGRLTRTYQYNRETELVLEKTLEGSMRRTEQEESLRELIKFSVLKHYHYNAAFDIAGSIAQVISHVNTLSIENSQSVKVQLQDIDGKLTWLMSIHVLEVAEQ